MFTHQSLVGGVGSGAGALRVGKGANQTGNLLEMMNTSVLTPQLDVGLKTHSGPNGVHKKRFGSTGVNHMYDYPHHPVKGGGNGQAYQMSKAGYLPGNGGGGQAGYGCHDPHAYGFNEAADLTEAKSIAMQEAHVEPHFVNPEHMQYVDRTRQSIVERFQEQSEDFQRLRIKDWLSKGFSEEEITKKVEEERKKAMDKAEKMPMNTTLLMEAKLAQMLPTKLTEDFPTSVAPGGIARRQDATAVERATNVGNPVAFKKKAEAIRHEQRLRGEINYVEPPQVKEPVSFKEMMADVVKESVTQVATKHEHDVEVEGKHIAVQMTKQDAMAHQESRLEEALGVKMGRSRRTEKEMSEAYAMGAEDMPQYQGAKLKKALGKRVMDSPHLPTAASTARDSHTAMRAALTDSMQTKISDYFK